MNRRELSLSVLVVVGLFLTSATLLRPKVYDCNQPLFSSASSCSVTGGSCINPHNRAGIAGLWSYIAGENCPLISGNCPLVITQETKEK